MGDAGSWGRTVPATACADRPSPSFRRLSVTGGIARIDTSFRFIFLAPGLGKRADLPTGVSDGWWNARGGGFCPIHARVAKDGR